jgi:adenylate cyclase
VVGPVFSERLLREVAAEPESLHDALALLVDASLLTDASQPFGAQARTSAGQGQYRFCHGLFHEAAYQNLLVRRRTELHTRIGRALERLCGDTPQRLEDLEALGHHFGLSVDKARGARYLVAAGDWARRIYANADAIRLYERALETLEACDGCDAERLVVHERLGELLSLTGQRAAALFHLAAARAGYSGAGDLPGQARVLRKIGALHWAAGDRTEAVRCTEEGLRLIEGGPEHVERAHLYQERGQMAFRSGDNHGAVLWAERALAHAERIAAGTAAAMDDERRETSRAMSLALNTLGVTLARLDRPAEALAHLERSVSIAREANLLQAECSGLANLGVLYSTLDPARAIATCERGLATAKRIGDLGLQSRLYANLAVAYCGLTNRCDERGIEAAQTAIELDRQLAQLDHLAVPLIVLAQIYQCHGEPARALGHYQEAMALAESVGEPQLLFPCYDGLATLYLDMGEADRADHYMRKAQEVCERARLEPDALTVLPFLV